MSTPFVKVDTTTITTVKCKCPLCGKHEWTVSHLFESAAKQKEGFYPVYWSCDKCRAKFDIRVYADQHVEMSQTGVEENPFLPTVVLLRSNTGDNQERPIYAVVRGGTHKDALDKEKDQRFSSHLDYHYNEGTCPTNWWRDTICLIQEQDEDPHGCFEFVGVLDEAELLAKLKAMPDADQRHADDPKEYIGDNVRLIFPLLFEDGETFDAESVMRDILAAPVPTNVQKVIAQGSMDQQQPADGDVVVDFGDTTKQMNNARAWRELFLRLERRELVEQFKIHCALTQDMAEALVQSKVAEAHPAQFDAVEWFMNHHNIPGFDAVDPLRVPKQSLASAIGEAEVKLGRGLIDIYGSSSGFLLMPSVDTIEDEIPPMSQAFHDKVAAEGGVITANGIVPKESLAQATGEAEVRQSTAITIEPFNHADQE